MTDGAIDTSVPQAPFHSRDLPVDGRKGFEEIGLGSHHEVRDLLHRLDPHGNVEPVDNMRRRFRQDTRQALEDFSPIREHGNVAVTAIPLPSKRMPSSIPDCLVIGVGSDKTAAAAIAATTTTTSGNNKLEASG